LALPLLKVLYARQKWMAQNTIQIYGLRN
jgi:hypothetical protein